MAEEVLIGPYLSVAGTDLSDHLTSLTINREGALEEWTPSNVGGTIVYKRRLLGTVDFNIVAEFADDYAASKVHQTLSTVFGTAFTVIAALHGATPASTNEVWTDTMTYANLAAGGAVGTLLKKSITFVHASGTPVADVTP